MGSTLLLVLVLVIIVAVALWSATGDTSGKAGDSVGSSRSGDGQ